MQALLTLVAVLGMLVVAVLGIAYWPSRSTCISLLLLK
jgi:hypothetical protein